MFDPAHTDLYLIGLMCIVVVVSNFINARIMAARVAEMERRIIDELNAPLDEEDLPLWTPADGPPLDERNYG